VSSLPLIQKERGFVKDDLSNSIPRKLPLLLSSVYHSTPIAAHANSMNKRRATSSATAPKTEAAQTPMTVNRARLDVCYVCMTRGKLETGPEIATDRGTL
jgi:hypothetical protein